MAKKKLEGIVWPNLPDDTYYLDAEKVEYSEDETYPSGSVGKALSEKAKIDGYYSNLTAGSAEQLLSTVTIEDEVPYLFRTSGGSVDIGDRETDMLVGGTVAWNQLMKDPTLATNIDGSKVTVSVSNGIATLTANGSGTAYVLMNCTLPPANHAILMSCDVMLDSGNSSDYSQTAIMTSWTNGAKFISNATKGTWKTIVSIVKPTSNPSAFAVYPFGVDNATASGEKAYIKNPIYIDLTQMFGSTIADYIYSLEQANAGAGVAFFRKLFPKPYYAYNAGELLSVSGVSSHDMVGFNAWDEEWELGSINTATGANATDSTKIRSKNYIPVISNVNYYLRLPVGNAYGVCYDSEKNYVGKISITGTSNLANHVFTTSTESCYMRFFVENYGTTYNHDICINLSWDGERDGEYEAYVKHSYQLDSSLTLRGIPKLDASNNLYYDGDIYEPDGTVTRRYKAVVLNGTETWSGTPSSGWYTQVNDMKKRTSYLGYMIADKVVAPNFAKGGLYGYIDVNNQYPNENWIYYKNTTLANGAEVKAHFASNPITVVYELATPTTESADPYNGTQIVDDFGTEEYVSASIVPVGHKTQYMPNLRAKLEMAPNSPNGNGDYIVRQTNGMNEYVPLVIEDTLPTIPSTAGSYRLTVTVTEGSDPVLSWEAE